MRVCGNRCHALIFKDKDNRKTLVYAEKNGLQNCYLRFLKLWKYWKFWDVFQYFLSLQKIPPNFKIFKNRNTCTRKSPKNCMYQVSRNSRHKRCFYTILNVKNGYFSGYLILDAMPCNSIYPFILFRFLCNKHGSKVIFRVLDERPTHKHVLRRKMAEIGNLTSWPLMTLTSAKVTSG